jgi:hypothetical protein
MQIASYPGSGIGGSPVRRAEFVHIHVRGRAPLIVGIHYDLAQSIKFVISSFSPRSLSASRTSKPETFDIDMINHCKLFLDMPLP